MARHDSPDSPLSSMDSSDEFPEDATEVMEHEDDGPPPKRQKIGGSNSSSAMVHAEPEPDSLEYMSDVSSDTDGDIPSSPIHARPEEDDFQEQVTTCAWEGCKAGELRNMDRLVEHIHNDHIESRQKKYTCEWNGCPRKSMPHASGYALKAHMRSHTREKPFYCYLPECDRSFTRSDALAKHMRTVHETEALRPSDPVPKSMQTAAGAGGKAGKLKIIIKTPQSHVAGQDDAADEIGGGNSDEFAADMFTPLTEDIGFTREELNMPLERLFKVCKLQLRWAERDRDELLKECRQWEELYKQEWLEKEVLLDQVVQSELSYHRRRRAIRDGLMDIQIAGTVVNGPTTDTEDNSTNQYGGASLDPV